MKKEIEILRQMRLDQLRKEIEVGIRQADAGELAPLDMEAIKAEGRRRLLERGGGTTGKIMTQKLEKIPEAKKA